MQELIECVSEYELKCAKFVVKELSKLSTSCIDSIFDMLLITTNVSL